MQRRGWVRARRGDSPADALSKGRGMLQPYICPLSPAGGRTRGGPAAQPPGGWAVRGITDCLARWSGSASPADAWRQVEELDSCRDLVAGYDATGPNRRAAPSAARRGLAVLWGPGRGRGPAPPSADPGVAGMSGRLGSSCGLAGGCNLPALSFPVRPSARGPGRTRSFESLA